MEMTIGGHKMCI